MKIAVPKEVFPGERRVALTPESVGRLVKKGFAVWVESGAGQASFFEDREYEAAGARLVENVEELLSQADLVVKVRPPGMRESLGRDEADLLREGTVLVAFLNPLHNLELVQRLVQRRITAFSMDAIPRTTLAQSMDALSAMATIVGYRAALVAAQALPKFFPMLMTAAGTIPPARTLVLGAGVAGLQAMATAKRLGATVEAFDPRPAAKEQVESLGVKFVEVPLEEGDLIETQDGYAAGVSEAYKQRQAEVLRKHIVRADVVITTARILGQRAPILITEDMVREMRPGTVIVDVAAEEGGNCALTEPGKEVVRYGVRIFGLVNIPSSLPVHASQMYSRNLERFLLHIADKEGVRIRMEDEITRGALITHEGEITHEATRNRLQSQQGGSS